VFEVRIHGRGGQGVVTAAELLAAAAFAEGRYAQAFPSFGSERTGAPVVSFCRIDDRPIRTREPVTHPDALIIGDPTLLHQVSVFDGAGNGTLVLINTSRDARISASASSPAHCTRPVPSPCPPPNWPWSTWAVRFRTRHCSAPSPR
jgi:pyruvate ferredoxin oxidoreductase gamma subunit